MTQGQLFSPPCTALSQRRARDFMRECRRALQAIERSMISAFVPQRAVTTFRIIQRFVILGRA